NRGIDLHISRARAGHYSSSAVVAIGYYGEVGHSNIPIGAKPLSSGLDQISKKNSWDHFNVDTIQQIFFLQLI
ncbi:MAG: hypothetical protein ACYS0I_12910, partial [Planctomycetota bacterium]